MYRIKLCAICFAVTACLISTDAIAVPTGVGYSVTLVDTPELVVGDVVVAGDAVFVGAGRFGSQSLFRIDSGGPTALAAGFSSMAGMAYDSVHDRLYFGDNGLEFSSSGSGDTLYALDNARSSAGGLAASDLEVFASGSISNFADVTLDPTDPGGTTLFISDAADPPGSILRADVGLALILSVQAVAPFAAGLAATNTTLFAGTSTFPPDGNVFSTPLPGGDGLLSLLASGLPGQFDLEVSADGTLLSTSQDQLLRLDPVTGAVLEVIATNFAFAGGLHESNGVIYAIDTDFAASTSNVYAFQLVPEPGTGLLLMIGLIGIAGRRRALARIKSR